MESNAILSSSKMKLVELRGHEKSVKIIKFNLEGDLFFSGGFERTVYVWSNHTFERIGSYKTQSPVRWLDVTNDSKFLITGSLDGTINVFEVDGGGKSVGSYNILQKRCKYLELSQGNQFLVVLLEEHDGNAPNEVHVYKFKDFIQELKKYNGKTVPVDSIPIMTRFSLNEHAATRVCYGYLNKQFFVTTLAGLLMKYTLDGELIQTVTAHSEKALSLVFSKDYSIMATSGNDGCRFWDPDTLNCIRYFKQEIQMNTVAISPLFSRSTEDIKYHCIMGGGIVIRELVTCKDFGYNIHLCNIMYEKVLGTIKNFHYGPINHLVFQPDGRGFISAGEEGIIRCISFDENYLKSETFE